MSGNTVSGDARPVRRPVAGQAGAVAGPSAAAPFIDHHAKAPAWCDDEWKKATTAAWGQAPMLEYPDCPIVVDAVRVRSRHA